MEEEEESGLFNITLEPEETVDEQRLPRDHQSEEDFQDIKLRWEPRSETGELAKGLKLPIQAPTKQESQRILHAIEELYYLRRYGEAMSVASSALKGRLQEDFQKLLIGYEEKCRDKMEMKNRGWQPLQAA